MDITILEALEITTEEVKRYSDNRPVVSYENIQSLDKLSRIIAKNNMGVYVAAEEPGDALDGDIWIDIDEGIGVGTGPSSGGGSNVNISLDDTLTLPGMAADAKAVGDAISELSLFVDEDGYTKLSGLRQATSINMVKDGNKIVVTTTYEGGTTVKSAINLDENDNPISIVVNGVVCSVSMEGFE